MESETGMKGILIRHATIVTVNPKREILFDGAMLIQEDRIMRIGRDLDVFSGLAADLREIDVIDASGKIIFPGFINTHNHLFQTLLKGLGDDMCLKDWLRTMTFPAAAHLDEEDCYYAALTGLLENIRSGVTTSLDYMYPHPRSDLDFGVLRAMNEMKIRSIFARGCMDTGEEFGVDPRIMETSCEIEKRVAELFDSYSGHPKIKIWVAPAALWSNTSRTLEMLWKLTNAYNGGFTCHISETMFDRKAVEGLHGCSESDVLKKHHILGPNVLMVHCVYLTAEEIRLAAENGLSVSHNPVSNMYLSSGAAPIPQMLLTGLNVSLGVDGAASNNGQDFVELMKTASLLQKVKTLEPTSISAEKVLEMATIDGARALCMEKEIGSLEVGKKADFVIFNPMLNPKAIPVHNPVSTLIYSSTMQNIESVFVDGEALLREGKILSVNEKEVLKTSQKRADMLAERAEITNRGNMHKWFNPYENGKSRGAQNV